MAYNVTEKLINTHLVSGKVIPGTEIGLKIDQTLMQDATGTMVMLELEAMNCDKVKTEISVQYVDHNILQVDFKNADDHLFLQSACERFNIWFSPAGNGVSHPVHMERVGKPGKTLLGSDSHTCAAGGLGMLAIGVGGLEVALAMMGEPAFIHMPVICGIHLTGKIPPFVSAKDVVLHMLRHFNVEGGVGKIFEYYGDGLKELTAMDRHVIANMGAEMGATASVFPSDEEIRRYLKTQNREKDWQLITADVDASYDEHFAIDLSQLEPLIACPSSPGNVVPVREVAGKEIYQSMIGSSANPGFRDFAIPALMVADKKINRAVSFDVNPTSRQMLENLIEHSYLQKLVKAGARIHQAGCNGCIGMGQAPATGRNSLRTVPRNFPGRSGTKEDSVYLCSPETAAASALTGVITDPRTLGIAYPEFVEPTNLVIDENIPIAPLNANPRAQLVMGPNIKALPEFEPLVNEVNGPLLLKMGNNISTDEILPAGAKVLPLRSNIPEIAKFTFAQIDETFYQRTMLHQKTGSFVMAGENYGQGSSREHAAITPRFLGVKAVIAISYARIHRENLINFGIIPFLFDNHEDLDAFVQGDVLALNNIRKAIESGDHIILINQTNNRMIKLSIHLSERERTNLLAGGLINVVKSKK